MLVGIQGFGEDIVAREDHDYGEVFVDEGEDAVFEFAGHDGFAVEVGDFFDFEGTCLDFLFELVSLGPLSISFG